MFIRSVENVRVKRVNTTNFACSFWPVSLDKADVGTENGLLKYNFM